MAGKSKVRNALRSAFGRVEKVSIRDSQGNIIRTIEDPDEFEFFIRENRNNVTDFQHEVVPRNSNSLKTTYESYRKSIIRATGRSPSIILKNKGEDPMDSENNNSIENRQVKKGRFSSIRSKISWKKSKRGPAGAPGAVGVPQGKKPSTIKTMLKGRQLKTFRKLQKQPYSKYLSIGQMERAASVDPVSRKMLLAQAKKMYRDPAYRAKIQAKREAGKGYYEARLERARRESQRRMKAAKSPFWRAWYGLSHNLWVLIGVVLAIAILFLPIGMFHVLGWALAVGIVSLVMFIIWVFIELWWMIAQALVAVINLFGQVIVGVFNYIGGAIAGALGQSFTPFQHILVQNMHIVERGPNGERIILGITWGEWNLIPPSFLKLDEFMPREFDTDVLIVKLWPALRSFFNWYTNPIAERYTAWISTAPWYVVGATIGIPIALIIIAIVVAALYVRRKMI